MGCAATGPTQVFWPRSNGIQVILYFNINNKIWKKITMDEFIYDINNLEYTYIYIYTLMKLCLHWWLNCRWSNISKEL